MKLTKIFNKVKKHQGTTDVDNQIKQILKENERQDVDDKVANPLAKTLRLLGAEHSKFASLVKDEMTVADVLAKLASKDLARDPSTETAYVFAFTKFVEVLRSISAAEQTIVQEQQDKYIIPLSHFHKQEVTEYTKLLRKQYEKATQEYNAILSKSESLHASKKHDILKLYEVEKERVRLKKIWENAVYDIRTHCEDLLERINFDYLEKFVECVETQKKQAGQMYAVLADIKDYLEQLVSWCTDERTYFTQHTTERARQRAQAHQEEASMEVRQFVSELDTEIIELVKRFAPTNPITPSQPAEIDATAAEIYQLFGVAAAASGQRISLVQAQLNTVDSSHPAIDKMRTLIKNNFDAIGTELLAKGKQDRLTSLSEAIALLERAPPSK